MPSVLYLVNNVLDFLALNLLGHPVLLLPEWLKYSFALHCRHQTSTRSVWDIQVTWAPTASPCAAPLKQICWEVSTFECDKACEQHETEFNIRSESLRLLLYWDRSESVYIKWIQLAKFKVLTASLLQESSQLLCCLTRWVPGSECITKAFNLLGTYCRRG